MKPNILLSEDSKDTRMIKIVIRFLFISELTACTHSHEPPRWLAFTTVSLTSSPAASYGIRSFFKFDTQHLGVMTGMISFLVFRFFLTLLGQMFYHLSFLFFTAAGSPAGSSYDSFFWDPAFHGVTASFELGFCLLCRWGGCSFFLLVIRYD